MKKRILLSLITSILLLSIIFSGCQTGISQELYEQVTAQVQEAQSNLAEAQKALSDLHAQKSAIDDELASAKDTIADLQQQVVALGEQASLIGVTPEETAIKIVKYYHETHVYSTYDMFICSDMASEVWNMLKAQGISAVIVVGNKDAAISDILQCDHAWVLANIGSGEYLALEATGGYAVKKSENYLYYRGWAFNSPADLKSYNNMIREYNTRVGFRNLINDEANEAMALYNASSGPAEAAKYEVLYSKLVEMRAEQETILNNLMDDIHDLATPISY